MDDLAACTPRNRFRIDSGSCVILRVDAIDVDAAVVNFFAYECCDAPPPRIRATLRAVVALERKNLPTTIVLLKNQIDERNANE